jgi:hypothetical protein
MSLEPWYRVVLPRKEVREGRSFNPDEFAIALEQIVARTAPEDYREPDKFFARNVFTRALTDHAGMVLRRLAGDTVNAAPVLTLVTQFGGGKTHTLATLYHLANNGAAAVGFKGVPELLKATGLPAVPSAKVAVFVGNAWDPQEGRETPWIDVARQIAGDEGVLALGPAARDAPPGTDTINRVIALAGQPVLLLFDEVLNALSRHRWLAEPMHAFLHNIVRGFLGTTNRAAVFSLPRSQVEMTDWEFEWQDRIQKVVGAVAKHVIVADEAEISEVIRRRLFEDLGDANKRRRVAKAYADWCFQRRAQLPPEWTAVDTGATESRARDFLQDRFEACYPFHPATLSVFQRKWQVLPQYQQTRGTLAMLAQWVSLAYRAGYTNARPEPLITLGSAPLDVPEFRSIVLSQLGEARLMAAIEADISGPLAHARALDADTQGPLRDIHRRVATAILFESSGGQVDKAAHWPELRFAIGEPDVETTSVDNAAVLMEGRSFFVRKVGADAFRIHYKSKLIKVMNDRRAALDDEREVKPAMRALAKEQFESGRSIPVIYFPTGGADVPGSAKLMLIVADPQTVWTGGEAQRREFSEWIRRQGEATRLNPAALVWCVAKPSRDLRDRVEQWLAWKKVKKDVDAGLLGADYEQSDLADLQTNITTARDEARDEVWSSYRYIVIADNATADGIREIDISAGHASAGETLCGRAIAALKSEALLNESPGAGYLERRWPPAFKETGAWPLVSLRQAFLTGGLERLLDPDAYLTGKIPEFVERGDFGLASGARPDGGFEHVWLQELLPPGEVMFEEGVFLLQKAKAEAFKKQETVPPLTPVAEPPPEDKKPGTTGGVPPRRGDEKGQQPEPEPHIVTPQATRTLRLSGAIPPEVWNRFGTKVIPKMRSGSGLAARVELEVTVNQEAAPALLAELRQILDELGLSDSVESETV